MKRRVKIDGSLSFVASLLVVFFPHLFFRRMTGTLWDKFLIALGITFILLGQTLRVSGRGYKSAFSHSGHSLAEGGPYVLVRNPMFLGILLIGLGLITMLFNWWTLFIFLGVFAWRYLLLILREEKKLVSMFGQSYLDYQKRVPRILPSLNLLLHRGVAEYLPLKLSWLKKEIGPIATLLLAVFVLRAWANMQGEDSGTYPEDAILILSAIAIFILFVVYLLRKTALKKDASNKSKNTL